MRTLIKWALILAGLVLLSAGLRWSYQRHHEAPEHEEEAAGEKRESEGEPSVKLTVEMQQRVGLEFAHPAATETAAEVVAFGQVIDPSPLAALGAELANAEAALRASKATAERERGLFAQQQNISRKVLEASEAQLLSDETRARALRRRMQLEWGQMVAGLEPGELESLLDALVRGESALLRVEVPVGSPLEEMPAAASISLLGHEGEAIAVQSISAAAAVDPKTQAQGFFLLAAHPPRKLLPGSAVVAHLSLPGEKTRGVLIPRSAIVRHEGKAWAYVKQGEEEFARREVSLERSTDQGWFVPAGITAEDELVVIGAQSLLSEELKGQMAEE